MICGIILRVWQSAMHTIQFGFGLVHFRLRTINLDFFWKIVTFLADNLKMEKYLFKTIFLHKNFLFANRFSNFLWHFFRLFECKIVNAHIFLEVFQKREMSKMQFLEDGVQTVDVLLFFPEVTFVFFLLIRHSVEDLLHAVAFRYIVFSVCILL